MSRSPTHPEAERSSLRDYLLGWGAIFEMSREGASWSGREENVVFLNTGSFPFADISGVSGVDFPDDGRAAAVTDWDLDGNLDLWLANRTGPRVRFLRNTGGAGKGFVAVRLQGKSSNRDAIGARLELTLEGPGRRRLIQTLRAGEGFLAQSSKWIHFGLDGAPGIESLVVRWPSGLVETFRDLQPNRRYRLAEGTGVAEPWEPPAETPRLRPSSPEVPRPKGTGRIVLSSRPRMPKLVYLDLAGQERSLEAGGRPLLVNLWASWCAPCVGELGSFVRHREALEEGDLRIVALSVEEDREQAARFIQELHPWFEVGFAPPRLVDVLDILQKALLERRERLALPTSFLVNSQGDLAVIYKGAVETGRLLGDLPLLPLDAFAIREASVPFPGRWATYPTPFPSSLLANEFASFGYPEVAVQYRAEAEGHAPTGAAGPGD